MSESKPTLEEDIERVLARMESGNGYRSSPQVSPQLVVRLQNKLSQLYPAQQPASQDELAPLSDRIKAIYPVIHRANDMFVGTKQGDLEVDVRKIRVRKGWFGKEQVRLRVHDNPYFTASGTDCGSIIGLMYGEDSLYSISRLRPTWKRADPRYDKRIVGERDDGESVADDECIDIVSTYFKIDCMPPKEFVKRLRLGSSEPVLRQSTLNHLLSLPKILGKYLDKKERGELV